MTQQFDDDEAKRQAEKRLFNAHRRLGTDTPICVGCGETYPHAIELHHWVGFGLDPTKVPACRNCHRRYTDGQKGWLEAIAGTPGINEIIGRLLLSWADIAEVAAPTLRRYAALASTLPPGVMDIMIAFADFIEAKVPSLRHYGRLALGYEADADNGQGTN